LPELVEIAQRLMAHRWIVDGEIVAGDEKCVFQLFQSLLERTLPRALQPEELAKRKEKIGVTVRAFDILFPNGNELTDLPLGERRRHLLEIAPTEYLAEGRDCNIEVEPTKFYEEALRASLEGIIVKSLTSSYAVGKRSYTWLKPVFIKLTVVVETAYQEIQETEDKASSYALRVPELFRSDLTRKWKTSTT